MLGHTLVAFVDNIMVGQLGTAELAAVSLGNSFMFIAMSLGIGFSTAITPLVAEADGENNFEKGKVINIQQKVLDVSENVKPTDLDVNLERLSDKNK